ncbi:MAG TPA: undecaprenyl-phosphate glucose phosphotransferase [Candidatus Aminicenantes bacterium]|nr:undecaprenyl-phosphate glucose phosphotransferase [Candidatus Aminicenantes bacterium]
MILQRRRTLFQLYVLSDIVAIVLAFHATFWLRFHAGLFAVPKGIPRYTLYLLVIPVLVFLHLVYFSNQGFYRVKLRRNRLDDLFLVVINCLLSSFSVLLIFSYLKSYRFVGFEISHVYLLTYAPVAVASLFLCRSLTFAFFRNRFMKRNGLSRVLIVGAGDLARMTATNLEKYAHFGIEVVGFLAPNPGPRVLGGFDRLAEVVGRHRVTDLFIALPLREYDTILALIETGNNLLVDIRLVPDMLQLASLKAGMEHIEGIPVINLGDIPLQGWSAFLKRGLDVLGATVGLIVLLPLLLPVALLVKLTSRGPLFYRQVRIGLDGHPFTILKFRTMIDRAEAQTGAVWAAPGDPRITSIGRFLRKYSIDELPQLFNVLRGDMSLVGPRPERPEFVEQFKLNIPRYMLRHRVKAGMTGWAQVHGLRGNTPLAERIEFDIYYIQNWTLRLDLEILWRTLLKFKFIDTTEG